MLIIAFGIALSWVAALIGLSVRDVETARIAVQSALTGHFVLSSLHATDAPSALHRLLA